MRQHHAKNRHEENIINILPELPHMFFGSQPALNGSYFLHPPSICKPFFQFIK